MNESLTTTHVDGSQLIEMFLSGRPPNTVRAYKKHLADFCAFAEIRQEELPMAGDAGLFAVGMRYVESLKVSRTSTATIAGRVSVVRSLFEFLCSIGLRRTNPLEHLRVPKVRHKSREYLTSEDVSKMLAAINRSETTGTRDYCIILMLAQLPLRRHELSSLRYGNLESADGRTILKFIGKRDQDRSMVLSKSVIDALAEYRQAAGVTVLSDEMPLFPNGGGKCLSDQAIYEIVQKYAELAGIGKHITPHTFKHFNITEAAHVEPNQAALQAFSGHRSISSLNQYTHFHKLDTFEDVQRKRGIV